MSSAPSANPACLPGNAFFAFPEVCGDYFAVLGRRGRRFVYSRVEPDGGIPVRYDRGEFRVIFHEIKQFNPQFCDSVGKAFGITPRLNAADGDVLGPNQAEALRMGYSAVQLEGRRLQLEAPQNPARLSRLYPFPEFGIYALLLKDPLSLFVAEMSSRGGFECISDGRVKLRPLTRMTRSLADAVNKLFDTRFTGYG